MTPPTICEYVFGSMDAEISRYVILSERSESKDLRTDFI